jgi:hypothetical protein
MIDILNAHLEELKDNLKNIEKSILRQIVVGDDLSYRFLNNDSVKLIHTLECLTQIAENIKSKNLREWIHRQQQQ